MKIKETIHQKVAVLSLRGKMMGPPATSDLHERIDSLLENGVSRIVLDLKHVSWINSLGLGALVKSYSAVQQAKGQLHLVRLSEKVRSVMVMSQLTKVFIIHESVEAAVEELNKL